MSKPCDKHGYCDLPADHPGECLNSTDVFTPNAAHQREFLRPIPGVRDLGPDWPFDGSRDHRDIRTFYTSELDYLRAMRKRYACANCGTSSRECASCQRQRERIEELERG